MKVNGDSFLGQVVTAMKGTEYAQMHASLAALERENRDLRAENERLRAMLASLRAAQ